MASGIPCNKEELITAIIKKRHALFKTLEELEALEGYDPYKKNLEGQVKDTKVSVCNLLTYLLGWSQIVIGWLDVQNIVTTKDNLLPEGYNFSSIKLGKLAQSFYKEYDHLDYDEMKNKLRQSYDELAGLLDMQTNATLYATLFYKKYSLGRMIDFNTRCPLNNIHKRLRVLRKTLL